MADGAFSLGLADPNAILQQLYQQQQMQQPGAFGIPGASAQPDYSAVQNYVNQLAQGREQVRGRQPSGALPSVEGGFEAPRYAFGTVFKSAEQRQYEAAAADLGAEYKKEGKSFGPEYYRDLSERMMQIGNTKGAWMAAQQAGILTAATAPQKNEMVTIKGGEYLQQPDGTWKYFPKQEGAESAPVVKSFREGKNIVNKQWNPATKTWEEVGRGPIGGGLNISVGGGGEREKLLSTIADDYRQETKDIVEKRLQISAIRNSANTPGGASAQALQSDIASLFGGQTRAVAELERWASYGRIDERIINSASRFLAGEYTDQGKMDALRLLRNYEEKVLNPKHEKINEKFSKRAKAVDVSTDFFMDEIPTYNRPDFKKMTPEQIASINPATLDLEDRAALEDYLTEMGY